MMGELCRAVNVGTAHTVESHRISQREIFDDVAALVVSKQIDRRFAAQHAFNNAFIEVMIGQESNQRFKPFARARSNRSSLLGPAGCEDSIRLRTAAASSSHWRR